MNVRAEAINLLKKLHRGLKFNYADSELKEIAEFLAGKITKEERLVERVAKLLSVIKSQQSEISDYKRMLKDSSPKTKAKEVLTYNYLETKVINEALEMLIGECQDTLKHDKVMSLQPIVNKMNLAKSILSKNEQKLKDLEDK